MGILYAIFLTALSACAEWGTSLELEIDAAICEYVTESIDLDYDYDACVSAVIDKHFDN